MDWKQYFNSHSIVEVRAIEKATRAEAEQKAQKTRLFIGRHDANLVRLANAIENIVQSSKKCDNQLLQLHKVIPGTKASSRWNNIATRVPKSELQDECFYNADEWLMIMVEHDISLSNSLLLSAKLCLIAKPMVNFMGDDDHRRTLNEIVARLKTHVEQHIADADLESGDVITENICAWVVLSGQALPETLDHILFKCLQKLTENEQSTINVLTSKFKRAALLAATVERVFSHDVERILAEIKIQPLLTQLDILSLIEIDFYTIRNTYPREVLEYTPWISAESISQDHLVARISGFIEDFCKVSEVKWHTTLATLESVADVFQTRQDIASILQAQQTTFSKFAFPLQNSVKLDLHSRLRLLFKKDAELISDIFLVVSQYLSKLDSATDNFNLHKYLWQFSSSQLARNKDDTFWVQEMCSSRCRNYSPSFGVIVRRLAQTYEVLDQSSSLLDQASETYNFDWDADQLSKTRTLFAADICAAFSNLDSNLTYTTAEILADLEDTWRNGTKTEVQVVMGKLLSLRSTITVVHEIHSTSRVTNISTIDFTSFGQQSLDNIQRGSVFFARKLVLESRFNLVIHSWATVSAEPSASMLSFAFFIYQSIVRVRLVEFTDLKAPFLEGLYHEIGILFEESNSTNLTANGTNANVEQSDGVSNTEAETETETVIETLNDETYHQGVKPHKVLNLRSMAADLVFLAHIIDDSQPNLEQILSSPHLLPFNSLFTNWSSDDQESMQTELRSTFNRVGTLFGYAKR